MTLCFSLSQGHWGLECDKSTWKNVTHFTGTARMYHLQKNSVEVPRHPQTPFNTKLKAE